jgi:cobalt/nickel transport system permease protein
MLRDRKLLTFYALVALWLTTTGLHIPDGFLSTAVALVGWVLMIGSVAYALRQTSGQLGDKQIPLMGVLAAFIFAAQAINFPVAGGTSGHLLGGALAAIIMGPWAAVLIMTSVIALQAILFQDGGLLALGFNVVNMGVLTAFTGYVTYQLIRRVMGEGRTSVLVAGAVGAWLSVVVGAIATAIQLSISGTTPLGVALPAMAGVHALIGVGEALITVGALSFIFAARRDLLNIGEAAPGKTSATWWLGGLAVSLIVAVFSFAASPDPDGLERVAEDTGFLGAAQDSLYTIFPDYTLPFVGDPLISGILAVVLGTLIVFAIAFGIARLQGRKAS